MAGAADQMIVHHPHRLHKGVTDGAADEGKTTFLERFRHGIRLRRGRRNIAIALALVDDGGTADKAPQIIDEVDALGLQRQIGAGVFDDRLHLEPVADNAAVLHQPLHILLVELHDAPRIEVGIGAVIALGALEDGDPRQPRLLAVEAELGKQLAGVIDRPAPLFVMVFNVFRVLGHPGAAQFHFLSLVISAVSPTLPTLQAALLTSYTGQPARPARAQHHPANPLQFRLLSDHARRYTPSVHIQQILL